MSKRAHFRFLTGDVDYVTYGGSWVRKVGEGKFHVMTIMNWNECEEEPDLQYNVSLSEVDVAATTDTQMHDALHCSCLHNDEDVAELAKVEALHAFGAAAPLHEGNGNNYRRLMAECRAHSLALTNDPRFYAEQMARPVNRMGSTAREYQQGDIKSAITRGVLGNQPSANLMARIHGATQADLNTFRETDHDNTVAVYVPDNETDPLAYVAGAVDAFAGNNMHRGSDIAPAYIRGYKKTVDRKAR